jgi:hydroxymethylpyrimidine kinase/phosphomethylpyrimidine kinase
MTHTKQPIALTIAGFDPSGGAGIIADVRTFVHFGVGPAAAITSLTFQNSERVFGATHETAESLRAQILPVVEEGGIAAVKIGMLPTADLVFEIVRLLAETDLPAPVIDPVLQSSSGYALMEKEAVDALVTELMPLAHLLTPNIPEAETLTGLRIAGEDDMREAAAMIRAMGAPAVLLKGGHLGKESEEEPRYAIDVFDAEGDVKIFSGEWIESSPVRGTGCMLSSAIAACLARGMSLEESVGAGRDFVTETIRNAATQRAATDSESAAGR